MAHALLRLSLEARLVWADEGGGLRIRYTLIGIWPEQRVERRGERAFVRYPLIRGDPLLLING